MKTKFWMLGLLVLAGGGAAFSQQDDVAEAKQSAAAAAPLGTVSPVARKVRVGKNQVLAAFARTQGLGAEHLAWANGLKPGSSVKAGDILKVPSRILPADPPKNGAVVNVAERGVYLFKNGAFEGFFPLSIGRNDKQEYRTPTGNYKITSRDLNPEWIAPESEWAKAMNKERIAGGAKNNPLGSYWFGINHPKGGYGFHENVVPDYTGDTASHGCMRLNPEHAKRIYKEKLLEPGMVVRIENNPLVLGRDASGALVAAVYPATYGKDASGSKKKLSEVQPSLTQERLQTLLNKPTGMLVKI